MNPPTDQIRSELENFRKEWQAEVSARARNTSASQPRSSNQAVSSSTSSSSNRPPRRNEQPHKKSASRTYNLLEDEDDHYVQARSFDDPEPGRVSDGRGLYDDESRGLKGKCGEPQSAIDFYEAAVEKETSGKLGDSLQLYRKAFRMDSRVDQLYKNKHFATAWRAKPPAPAGQVNPSNAPATVPGTAHHPLEGPTLSVSDLIASFAGLAIQGSPPEVEGVPPPPCPIAELPDEILVHILRDVAVADVGDFVRLSRVCKRLAYLVAAEEQIWRRVCLGSEVGFGAMHHHFQQGVRWEPLDAAESEAEELGGNDAFAAMAEEEEKELAARRRAEQRATTDALLHGAYGSSWRHMFRRRPRVRFNGCYISTVNYIRAGQASGHQITWNSPVHIVTYYRYLRLFRDGTAISLLTTEEPAHVVHHLTKDLLRLHHSGAAQHLPSAVMGQALKGRWRLSGPLDSPDVGEGGAAEGTANLADMEGTLFVETEGVDPKYIYRMDLSMRSAGKTARNNKLVWKGFWSYNKLTDDWGDFGLRHDKPFFFSRVKSYGIGA
ncbi:hypothetical protein DL766_009196 [Monosporascus sp. MC13-8B]|uniref:F-box domain-containing protein n=1 Tax=Monosporascus cannonballus TaxID=155416 RepID=A0ABY0H5B5_9PEZI|nr:hypothetical protein DL762_005665 [Monosporascus cannonballus]RYO87065.1 hypothetical protein DL763_006508 [Monosporascus cannonballus]RYP16171.1 hypothetical protein DL766_009196 [Monosporascus sp. MC13-8B]